MKRNEHGDERPESSGAEKISAKGVFWFIEGKILAVKYDSDAKYGVAKAGGNYNHKLIWDYVKPRKCNKPYDYYPRGRVEIDNKGRYMIYLNINISDKYIPEIIKAFYLPDNPRIHYDGSDHYKSHLD